jgi:gluconolactonase
MLHSIHEVKVIATGLDHPECVNFGPDGFGYAGGELGQVFRFDLDGNVRQIASTGSGIGGVCLDGDGNVYECNYGKPHVHKITPDGKVSVYSRGTDQRPAVTPNYAVFDSKGNLYYSDSGDYYKATGGIFVVRPNGVTEHLLGDHLHFPNGLAIDADETFLYVIQTTAQNVLRFPLQDGRIGEGEIYIQLPGTAPDGLAFAESGNLYVSCYVPDVIFRVTPRRIVETVVQDFGGDKLNRPTNVAFAPGTDLLCIANIGGTGIHALSVGEKGLPLRYPRGLG